MELKRFLITEKANGAFVAAVYAERFEQYCEVNSFTGAHGGHFWIERTPVASVELAKYDVGDSGGRFQG